MPNVGKPDTTYSACLNLLARCILRLQYREEVPLRVYYGRQQISVTFASVYDYYQKKMKELGE
jgi:hypothetical protein